MSVRKCIGVYLKLYMIKELCLWGGTYKSSEAAYQSCKTTDPAIRNKFIGLSAMKSKTLGRSLPLRPDWEQIKCLVMYEVCWAKFLQNEDCRRVLLKAGDAILIENTTGWCDHVWGICYCPKCGATGANLLGQTLMRVRNDLRIKGY